MELLDVMQSDLDSLRELIIEVRTAEDESEHESEAFNALVSQSKSQANAHEKLFEALHTSPGQLSDAIAASRERTEAAENLEQIIECCSNRSTWHASVSVYCELLEQKITQELHDLLPALFDNYPSAQRKKLAQVYARVRGFGRVTDRRVGRTPERLVQEHMTRWQAIWRRVLNEAG